MKKTALATGLVAVLILATPMLLVVAIVFTAQSESALTGSPYCQVAIADGTATVVGDGGQGTWDLSQAQLANAAAIMSVGRSRGLPERAVVIAVQTAIGESRLRNLANDGSFVRPASSTVMTENEWLVARAVARESLNYPHDGVGADWDSIGLFQQRPSAGWGSPQQLLDQTFAAGKFFDALERTDWQNLANVQVIAQVQRSVNPQTYVRFEPSAQQIVSMAGLDCDLGELTSPLPGYRVSSSFNPARINPYTGIVQLHGGTDIAAPMGTPIVAAASGTVIHTGCSVYNGNSPCQIYIDHGGDVVTRYVHMYPSGVLVSVGQQVTIGQTIGLVGSNGNSTGPHLHFEVVVNGDRIDPEEFYRTRAIPIT